VGNALRSGRVAAEHLENCFRLNRFDATFNRQYDKEIYHRLLPEFRLNRLIRQLCRTPGVLNYFIGAAGRFPQLNQTFVNALYAMTKNSFGEKFRFLCKTLSIFTLQYFSLLPFKKKNKAKEH
jgi:hypothetical protein